MIQGWFVDDPPPTRAPGGFADIEGGIPGELYAHGQLARWTGSGAPKKQDCSGLLNSRPGQRKTDVKVGDRVCFTTEKGRLASLTLVDDQGAEMTVDVTVWER